MLRLKFTYEVIYIGIFSAQSGPKGTLEFRNFILVLGKSGQLSTWLSMRTAGRVSVQFKSMNFLCYCSRLSCLLYGILTRALLKFLKLAFLSLFLQILSLVSANTPSLKANPQLCISSSTFLSYCRWWCRPALSLRNARSPSVRGRLSRYFKTSPNRRARYKATEVRATN